MPPKLTLISIRLHPQILALADQFAALQNTAPKWDPFTNTSEHDTRSTVLRKALALGLPLLINPPKHKTEGHPLCPAGTPDRQKTLPDPATDSSEHRQADLLPLMSSTTNSQGVRPIT